MTVFMRHKQRLTAQAGRFGRPGGPAAAVAWLAAATGLFWVAVSGQTTAAAKPEDRPMPTISAGRRAFFEQHCLDCHGPETDSNVRLDTIPFRIVSVADADRWQAVLDVLNSGEMPPRDEPQPTAGEKLELLDELATTMVAARRALADEGRRAVMRRLSRREYANTIESLLGVRVEVGDLPADNTGSFDTVGSSLFISAEQIEKYLEIGRRALDEAARWADFKPPESPHAIRVEPEVAVNPWLAAERDKLKAGYDAYLAYKQALVACVDLPENAAVRDELKQAGLTTDNPDQLFRFLMAYQWNSKLVKKPSEGEFGFHKRFAGVNFTRSLYERDHQYVADYFTIPEHERGICLMIGQGAREATIATKKGAAAGRYLLRIRAAPFPDSPPARRFIDIGRGDHLDTFSVLACRQVTGSLKQPCLIEVPVVVPLQNWNQAIRFQIREKTWHSRSELAPIITASLAATGSGPKPAVWIDWVELVGPLTDGPTGGNPIGDRWRAILAAGENSGEGAEDRPTADTADEARRARAILGAFVREAFRGRPPLDAYLDELVGLFVARRAANESFGVAIREPLSVVLASPSFLYLTEPADSEAARPLDGRELASRLAYFLWSGPPDAALLDQAAAGSLADPDVLTAEVDRMLADPCSRRFVEDFLHQWLYLDRIDFFRFSSSLHPGFDVSTKAAAVEEVYETFSHLIACNGSLGRLLDSDEVVVNGLLAAWYGLEGVEGEAFRPVKLPAGSPRGGLLGMSAILAIGNANGETSHPIERGAWVLRKLLNDPPPPAPANVPQLTRLEGRLLTTRERFLAHQEEPQCASCHRKIDPIGFGLENFDAVGRWRTHDAIEKKKLGRKEWEIDASGQLHGGSEFADFHELKRLIAGRDDAFARGFIEALATYALGRQIGFADREWIDAVLAEVGAKGYPLRDMLRAIVTSEAFRTK